jgi:hypothetical protein
MVLGRFRDGAVRRLETRLRTALPLVLWVLATPPAWAQAVDPRDRVALDRALNRTLEVARMSDTTRWDNGETGVTGTIVVERTFYRDLDEPCRSYRWTLQQGDRALQGQGTGCRNRREDWTLEEDPPRPAAVRAGATSAAPRQPTRTAAPQPVAGARETSPAPAANPPDAAAKTPPKDERPVSIPKYTLPARTPL